ncbi:MAG: hypothetical protein WDW38_009704 [Sanguina aurantia]
MLDARKLNLPAMLASGMAAVAMNLLSVQMAHAEFRLPPIDIKDPDRCARGYVGNTIGQANAVSDKLLDMRKCSYKGANLSAKVLAGALMSEADLSETNLQEAVLTKAYAVNANFENADMTNAVLDRSDFSKSNMKGVKFNNAVVTGATFEGTDLTGTIWEEALVGGEDVKRLCANPTLVGESRDQVGCRVSSNR